MAGWLVGWMDGLMVGRMDGWVLQRTSRLDSHSESTADVLLNLGVWDHRHRRERAQDASSLLTYLFTYLLYLLTSLQLARLHGRMMPEVRRRREELHESVMI